MNANRILTELALALALAGLTANITYAAVIYDNAAVIDWAVESDPSHALIPAPLSDDFILQPGVNVITDIHWTGTYGYASTETEPDNFTIYIFADGGGVPAAQPLHTIAVGDPGRVDTGIEFIDPPPVIALNVFAYSASFPAIILPADTRFWLVIANDTTADADDIWLWAGQTNVGNAVYDVFGAQPWLPVDPPFRADFQLTNDAAVTIPEPGSLFLVGIALVGLMLCAAPARRRCEL